MTADLPPWRGIITAPGIWLAASAAIVAGAAQFKLLAVAMSFGLAILILLQVSERFGLSKKD